MPLTSIAFIPDGNRRYASAHRLSLLQAYQLGTQKSWEVMDWMVKYPSIRVGTFYTLSLENITRSSAELHVLFKIFENEADKILEKEIYKTHDLAINFLGRVEKFPKHLQQKMQRIQDISRDYGKRVINVAIGYNGRAEIVDAAKKFALAVQENPKKMNELNEESFKQYLYNDFSDPDMIVRTGYTQRLSGFLTYQSVYSELYFLDKFWPEFSAQDLDAAVAEFDARQRRFGK